MLAAAALSFVAAVCGIEDLGPEAVQVRLLAAASLGLPLFTALTLFLEEREWPARWRALVLGGGVLILAGFYLDWPAWSDNMRGMRYAELSIAFHLAVAFLPPAGLGEVAFWQYNRRIFVRFLAAALSSGVLYLGFVLAIAAVHVLFDVDVDNNGYLRLWVLIAFLFNTAFFLGGVPRRLRELEGDADYPQALRVFAQYTLVPLVSIYLVILTLYLAKVLVTWDWPRGWIGWLVTGVSATGILALLLVHPLAEREDQTWIRVFHRDFWIAVMPAVVMLWLAIWQRVRQYGVTEPRYFLLVLSVWLGAMAVYYTVTRSRRIRIIPISLCGLAIAAFAGPWGAYAVSARSQVARLRTLMERHHLRPGAKPDSSIATRDLKEISGIVRYLVENHDARPVLPLIGEAVHYQVRDRERGEERVRAAVNALGAAYVERWSATPLGGGTLILEAPVPRQVMVRGYDMLLTVANVPDSMMTDTTMTAVGGPEWHALEIRRGREIVISIPLDGWLQSLPRVRHIGGDEFPDSLRVVRTEGPRGRAALLVEKVEVRQGRSARFIGSLSGQVLVTLNR